MARPARRLRGPADLSAPDSGPGCHAAVLGLAGQAVAPLGKGEGVLLVEDGGNCRVEPLD